MAKPTTRQELKDYCLRQLGAPVLEINVADEQVDDLLDDTIQYFNERHFDGVEKTYLKYKISQEDIDRGRGAGGGTVGVGMFSIKYQLFLNDLYYFNSVELLQYSMTKTYLEDIDMLLTTDKQVRFNQRQNRLYLDIDWESQTVGNYLVIECYRAMDPENFSKVYNDSFVKRYLTAAIKKQWGQNLIKFQGVKLPGGVELNGRAIYEDGQRELDEIRQKMSSDYELPPMDLIG